MSAPAGNTNATKWTEVRTIFTLERIEKYAQMDHVHTLSRALVKVRIYQGIWIYWKRRWAQHEEIMDRIGYIEQIFMMKIEEGGLSKRWHAGMCLFMLRVNYGQREKALHWKDRKEICEELPAHLVAAYDRSRQNDSDIEAEKKRKREQEEKEKAAKERAEKKAAKLKLQQEPKKEKAASMEQPLFTVYKNTSVSEHDDAVPRRDISEGKENNVHEEPPNDSENTMRDNQA